MIATLHELSRLGTPEEILARLRALVALGYDEAIVVLAFLTALARSAARTAFSRDARRVIEKAWRHMRAPDDLLGHAAELLRDSTLEEWPPVTTQPTSPATATPRTP